MRARHRHLPCKHNDELVCAACANKQLIKQSELTVYCQAGTLGQSAVTCASRSRYRTRVSDDKHACSECSEYKTAGQCMQYVTATGTEQQVLQFEHQQQPFSEDWIHVRQCGQLVGLSLQSSDTCCGKSFLRTPMEQCGQGTCTYGQLVDSCTDQGQPDGVRGDAGERV